jgi:hypothetical protein
MKKLDHFILILSFLYSMILGGELVASQKTVVKNAGRLGKMPKIQPPPGAIELELVFSIPTKEQEEKDQYFWEPYGIVSDPIGNIYVADFSNTVFKYDSEGKFIKKFGQSGQGPGDLSMPLKTISLNDSIVIAEAGNGRLQYFDFEGNSRKIVKLLRSYHSFEISNEGLIFGIPFQRQENESHLIEVLSPEGKLINSFGDLLDYKYDRSRLNRAFISLNSKGEILVAFEFFPIVRKYSQKGTLVGEFHIETEMMVEKEKYNNELYSLRPQESASFIQAVYRAREFGGHLFMLDFVPPRIYIMEMDEEGKLENTYFAIVGEKYFAVDILPKKEKNRMIFYILQRNPEAKANLFAPKNK